MSSMIPIAIVAFLGKVSAESFELFLQLRENTDHLNGCWEFPGGKVEAGENPLEAAVREVKEETDLSVEQEQLHLFNVYPFDYEKRSVSLFTYLYHVREMDKLPLEKVIISLDQSEELEIPIPEANKKILSDLKHYIARHMESGTWDSLWAM